MTGIFPNWQHYAACKGHPRPAIWMPAGGNQGDKVTTAKQICGTCPVRPSCLQYSIDNRLPGIWGGLGTREREELSGTWFDPKSALDDRTLRHADA